MHSCCADGRATNDTSESSSLRGTARIPEASSTRGTARMSEANRELDRTLFGRRQILLIFLGQQGICGICSSANAGVGPRKAGRHASRPEQEQSGWLHK
eukprot:3778260-Rhodomonas_salina.3